MRKLIFGFVILSMVGCASMSKKAKVDRKLTTIEEIDILVTGANQIKLETNEIPYKYTHTMIAPEEILKDFEKARAIHQKHDKKNHMEIEVAKYNVGTVSITYIFKEDARVRLCFENVKYTHITDIECASVGLDEIDEHIAALKKAPEKVKEIEKQIQKEKELKTAAH